MKNTPKNDQVAEEYKSNLNSKTQGFNLSQLIQGNNQQSNQAKRAAKRTKIEQAVQPGSNFRFFWQVYQQIKTA